MYTRGPTAIGPEDAGKKRSGFENLTSWIAFANRDWRFVVRELERKMEKEGVVERWSIGVCVIGYLIYMCTYVVGLRSQSRALGQEQVRAA